MLASGAERHLVVLLLAAGGKSTGSQSQAKEDVDANHFDRLGEVDRNEV